MGTRPEAENPEHPVARNQLRTIIILENDCLVLENRTGVYTIKQILFKYDHEKNGKNRLRGYRKRSADMQTAF
jgi:hypothetical protein